MDTLDDAPKIDFGVKLKSKGLNKLVQILFEQFPSKPQQQTYRQQLRDCLRIVLINLSSTDGHISYSRGDHGPQYRTKKYSAKNIRKVVDFLESAKLVENKLGYFLQGDPKSSRRSRITARSELKNLFKRYQINHQPILINPKNELIILKDASKRPVSYIETPFTRSAKENVNRINELSSHHSILDRNGNPIHRKAQHRVFNHDFKHGGRFYGGGWQSLNSKERSNLKIDGSPVVEYDFQAYHPTILYALKGMQLDRDLYSLKGYSSETRKFLKFAMMALINTDDRLKAKKAIQYEINLGKLEKPSEVTSIDDILSKFLKRHEPISDLFCNDTGSHLQRLDSDICEQVMLRFYQQDVLVLGVHDSFVIREDCGKTLYEVMEDVFFNKFNKKCKIVING